MPSFDLDITCEFEVFCAKCGAGICNNCTEGKTRNRGALFIQVTPCENCLEEAYDRGFNKGEDEERARHE